MLKTTTLSILLAIVLVLIIPASACVGSAWGPSYTGDARVTGVVDGDTIKVSNHGKTYKVRYIGIDTPELANQGNPAEYFGNEARAKNRELVAGKTVRLEKDISNTDRYNRLLRYVWIDDIMVNAELIRLGYARVVEYPPDVKYHDLFLDLQREAREQKLGIWAAE